MDLPEHGPLVALADDNEAEGRLWSEFAVHRDPVLRGALFERYLPYARAVAAGLYTSRSVREVEFADYLHFAVVGLIEALDRFDPARGVRFQTFAAYRIRGAILGNAAHLSERHEQIALRARSRKQRAESLAEEPCNRETGTLFEQMAGVAVGLAIGYMLEGTGMFVDPRDSREEDGYARCELREIRERIRAIVELLPDRERAIVQYHYYYGLSFEQIGALLQVSKTRVAQIHRRAVHALRGLHRRAARLNLRL